MTSWLLCSICRQLFPYTVGRSTITDVGSDTVQFQPTRSVLCLYSTGRMNWLARGMLFRATYVEIRSSARSQSAVWNICVCRSDASSAANKSNCRRHFPEDWSMSLRRCERHTANVNWRGAFISCQWTPMQLSPIAADPQLSRYLNSSSNNCYISLCTSNISFSNRLLCLEYVAWNNVTNIEKLV